MKKSLLLFLVVIAAKTGIAQSWNPDTTINTPICTFSNATTKQNMVTVSDPNGAMWIAWEDARNNATTGTDIYCQKIFPDGSVAFDAAGILVCNATGTQSALTITSDGTGGCIIAWTDTRTTATTSNDVYAQRINSSGTAVWATNGVVVSNGTVTELAAVVERISSTEVLIAWRDARNDATLTTGQDYFFNKLSINDGSKVLASDVVLVSANNTQSNLRLLADGNGNAFAVWQDPRLATTNADIFVQKINNAGTVAWTANGINLTSAATFNQANAQIISDGAGGIIVTWDDNRTTNTDQDIYAQKIDADGNVLWTAGGVAVSAVASSNQRNPFIVSDGAGGAIITWQDLRTTSTTGNDIYAQKINSSGVVQWQANGVLICNATGSQPNSTSGFVILTDGAGGAIIIWDDARIGTSDIDVRAQRITSSGVTSWTTNGTGVAVKSGSNQRLPVAIADGSGGAIIAWQDGRTTANCEIYASRITSAGLLPVNFLSVSATAKQSSVVVEWSTASEFNNSNFVVERSIDGTNFSRLATIVAKGTASNYSYEDVSAAQGDNYYRIVSVDKDGSTQLSKTVVASLQSIANRSLQVYPNPVKSNVIVKLQGAYSGKLQLKVIDAKGALVTTISTSATELAASKSINLQALQNGVYAIQVVNANGDILTSKMMLKY